MLVGVTEVRRQLRPGDPGAIATLHGDVYAHEYGLGHTFLADCFGAMGDALRRGWPDERGGVWLVDDDDGRLAGSLALVADDDRSARVRWFLLTAALRGNGLGGRMLSELVTEADAAGYERLTLETFSELETAGRLYRDAGFRVVDEEEKAEWGRTLVMQHYERTTGG